MVSSAAVESPNVPGTLQSGGWMQWHLLGQRVLGGHALTREECHAVLNCPDVELPDLLAATFRVRREHFGLKVHFYYLKNAKSGLCPEDCGYCSQSIISTAPIEKYTIANERVLMEGARKAKALNARTYCIVALILKNPANQLTTNARIFEGVASDGITKIRVKLTGADPANLQIDTVFPY